MKTKMAFTMIMVFGLFIIGCNQKVKEAKVDIINDEFSEAKQEVMETFGAIAQSI